LMMVAIFGVMYFFMIRPQQKKQKEIEKFRNSLKKGDKVVTIGGIYGTVAEIKEKYVLVEVDANVKLRIDKSAIVKDMSDVPAK
ncbi:MAG: preprotein translocase subunit YajC, partial [Bacteroidales bacterium]|nr:preprotein translocase subunit YajC [Bacteroidales bacterium]